MITNYHRNLFLNPHSWSTAMTKNLFLALLIAILGLLAPSSARAEQWEDPKAGPFTLGYWQRMDAGAVSIETAAAGIVANFSACERTYGPGNCYVQFKASTDSNHYESLENGRDSAWEGGLGSGRVNILKRAVFATNPNIAEFAVDELVLNHREKGYRYAWAVIKPKAGVLRLADLRPACSDGKDNDGDGLIDRDDPGCSDADGVYHADDNDEYNPEDPDDKWKFCVEVVLSQSANVCDTEVTCWIDESRQERWHVDIDDCECQTADVSEKKGFQMYSPSAIAAQAMEKEPIVHASTVDEKSTLTWTELRVKIEAPQRATNVEYIDSDENAVDNTWFGRGAHVTDRGNLVKVSFNGACDESLDAEHNGDYTGVDFILAASGTLGTQAVGMGNYVEHGPFGTTALEIGIEAGGPNGAFFGTVGIGGWFDNNCASTAAWLGTVRLGATINRSKPIGMLIDIRGLASYGPSVAIEVVTPDDPNTTEIEYEEQMVPAWGINTLGGLVEVGPRFAFGRGVKNGWVSPQLSAGPVQRWVYAPDGSLGTTVTADVGISVLGGFAF